MDGFLSWLWILVEKKVVQIFKKQLKNLRLCTSDLGKFVLKIIESAFFSAHNLIAF